PATVELVTVDAVVIDAKGKAVSGLTKDDFTVLENGVPQAVTRFEAVVLPSEPAPAPPVERRAPFSSNSTPQTRPGRTFEAVFDDLPLSPLQAQRAKAVVGEFLRTGTREGDNVTLIATGGSAWWTTRIPDGREELVTILKRLDGRFIPDSSPDRITDYE